MSENTQLFAIDRRSFVKGMIAGVSAITVLGIVGCGKSDPTPEPEPEPQPPVKEEWSFVDQNDYQVTVTVPCERMVVLQHHSLDILCQLGAQSKIVGVVDSWKKNLGDYMTTVFPGIESMATPGGLNSWNVEAIAELQPDVVIAASQAPEDAMKQIRELGIPVVVVSLRGEGKQAEAQNPRLANADAAYTEGCQWAVETLGKLSGTSEQAAKLWAFCEESRAMVDKAVGDVADADRPTVVAISGEIAYGNDKFVGCMLQRAGAVNAVSLAGVQGNTKYDAETLATWDPDFIITQDRNPADYQTVTTDAGYAELKAVKEGKVVEAPYWTKPWGNPDADSIALGELWLAHVFYPEKIDAKTVEARAKEFYSTFYGIDFTGSVN